MKKLNNKGVTLVELIISFALVSVAIIYFYQTLFTVKKLYTKSQQETQAFVDKTYALRILDAYIENYKDQDVVAVDFLLSYEQFKKNNGDLCSQQNVPDRYNGICQWIDNFNNSLKNLSEDKNPVYENINVVSYKSVELKNNSFLLSFEIELKNGEKVILYKSSSS